MLILEIIIATFAAWGFVCTAKLLMDDFFIPKRVKPTPSVHISGEESDLELLMLCRRASRGVLCEGQGLVLVVDADVADSILSRVISLELEGVTVAYVKESEGNVEQ